MFVQMSYYVYACTLTQEVRQQLGLVVVHHSHTHGVEAHQAEHRPVESLRLHYLTDEESHSPLLLTVIAVFAALNAGAGKTWKKGGRNGCEWESGNLESFFK